jgi:hypothetical protein
MAEERHEQHTAAEDVDEIPKAAEWIAQEGEVSEQVCVTTLRQHIKEQQETYRILYARNLLLYNELTDARKTIERLNALLHA